MLGTASHILCRYDRTQNTQNIKKNKNKYLKLFELISFVSSNLNRCWRDKEQPTLMHFSVYEKTDDKCTYLGCQVAS